MNYYDKKINNFLKKDFDVERISRFNLSRGGAEESGISRFTTSFGIINIKLNVNDGENFFIKDKFSNKKADKKIITSKKYPYIKCFICPDDEVVENVAVFKNSSDLNTISMSNSVKLNGIICDGDNETHMDICKFSYYKDKIKFLMVSRYFSLGFVEFVRGRYDVSNIIMIIELFEQMYAHEIIFIHKNTYNNILYHFQNRYNEDKDVVLNRMYEGKYSKEYCEAQMKFNMLSNPDDYPDNDIVWPLQFYTKNVKPKWEDREWGFPKGRKDKKTEENLECACREFEEETGYTKDNYLVLDKIEPIEEIMKGTDGVIYKHIYYLSLETEPDYKNDALNQNQNKYDKYEIGDIKWFSYEEAIAHIRPYHNEKKQILTKIYLFIINSLIHDIS